MALKYIKVEQPINSLQVGVLKHFGFKVLNDKIFIDEKHLSSDQSSKGRKSKNKGQNYERAIGKKLSEWWGKENSFIRTPKSGAWKFPMDLLPPFQCPFVISCKNEESWTGLEKTLSNKGHRFGKYLDEVEKDMQRIYADAQLVENSIGVKAYAIVPLIIFTRNNDTDYVILRKEDYLHLVDYFNEERHRIDFSFGVYGCTLMLLETFMRWAHKEGCIAYVYNETQEAE